MTPLRKHSGKRVFPLTDTLRFLMFPSPRFQRNRNTFSHVSDRFPFQGSRISAIVNVCLCCGNAIFPTGNLLFRSFYWRKREDTIQQPDLFLRVSVGFRYCVNTSKKFHICGNQVFQWEFFILTWNLTFEYFSWLTYMQWRLVHYLSQTNIYHHKSEIHLCYI